MKKAIITGPTGSVGVSLIEELIHNGIEVTAVCRPNSKRISNIPNSSLVEIIECDISGIKGLSERLQGKYDTFFHFAWDGTYGDARQNLKLQVRNIQYTLDAVDLAKKVGCNTFIGAGSQSEFGHVSGVLHPYLPCNPDNGYGIAKLDAGRISRIACKQKAIRHIWCRIVSLYGAYDAEYTMVMSGIIKMIKGERPQYTKGDQVWDYIYSKDSARAFRLIAEKGKDGSIYCIGTGKTRTLKEYIYAIRDAVNPDAEIGMGELSYYPNQVMHLEADISNLTADTGFVPLYSFEEGIKEVVDYVRMRTGN